MNSIPRSYYFLLLALLCGFSIVQLEANNSSVLTSSNSNIVTPDAEETYYKVKLGNFGSHRFHNLYPISCFGGIEKEKANDGAISLLLGSYGSRALAETILSQVIDLGYEDAHVVSYKNGLRQNYYDNSYDDNRPYVHNAPANTNPSGPGYGQATPATPQPTTPSYAGVIPTVPSSPTYAETIPATFQKSNLYYVPRGKMYQGYDITYNRVAIPATYNHQPAPPPQQNMDIQPPQYYVGTPDVQPQQPQQYYTPAPNPQPINRPGVRSKIISPPSNSDIGFTPFRVQEGVITSTPTHTPSYGIGTTTYTKPAAPSQYQAVPATPGHYQYQEPQPQPYVNVQPNQQPITIPPSLHAPAQQPYITHQPPVQYQESIPNTPTYAYPSAPTPAQPAQITTPAPTYVPGFNHEKRGNQYIVDEEKTPYNKLIEQRGVPIAPSMQVDMQKQKPIEQNRWQPNIKQNYSPLPIDGSAPIQQKYNPIQTTPPQNFNPSTAPTRNFFQYNGNNESGTINMSNTDFETAFVSDTNENIATVNNNLSIIEEVSSSFSNKKLDRQRARLAKRKSNLERKWRTLGSDAAKLREEANLKTF